jgi:transcriptional regulator with XRE-family HTH domain
MAPRSISAAQCRASRAILDWSRNQLAAKSGVALRTIVDFERGARAPREATLLSLVASFEAAGVVLVEENGEGPGVRLRKGK